MADLLSIVEEEEEEEEPGPGAIRPGSAKRRESLIADLREDSQVASVARKLAQAIGSRDGMQEIDAVFGIFDDGAFLTAACAAPTGSHLLSAAQMPVASSHQRNSTRG